MKQRFLLLLLFFCALACDSANPVAPTGTVLSISASPTQINLSGGSSRLTVTGFKPDGNPLNPGTQITLSTTLGVLSSTLVESDGTGRAAANLISDGRPGTATITATPASGGEASSTVDVLIGQTAETQPQLSITASPSVLGLGERATVTAVARNADGTLFGAGGSVLLRTDLGFFDNSGSCGSGSNSVTLTTSASSEARTFLCGGQQPGTVTITGSFGSSEEVTATVTIENQRPNLIINANPDNIAATGMSEITVIARDENDVPLGAGFEIQLLASFGTLDPETPTTDSSGRATAAFNPSGEFGTAVIQAFLGSSEAASVSIVVRGDVERVRFSTAPGSINVGQQTLSFVANVLNSRNIGIQGVIAVFEATRQTANGTSSVGRFRVAGTETDSDGAVLTVANGNAAIDLFLMLTETVAGETITVTVTVNREDGTSRTAMTDVGVNAP